MSRSEIKQTIDEFLSLVENGCGSVEENESKLKFLLDKLAFAQHFASYSYDEKEYPEGPAKSSQELREMAALRFPNFSYYNVAFEVANNIGSEKAIVGDSIDDIAGIAGDLSEVKRCWEKNSIEDGLWHFKNLFDMHWGRHLRGLQYYLLSFD